MNHNDKLIYENLFYDARVSTRQLAQFIGIKQPSIQARIKKLEEEKFIRKYDALPRLECLPFIHKIYYCSLTDSQIETLIKQPSCTTIQETFNSYSHQVFFYFKDEKELKQVEKLLPQKRVETTNTHSHRLNGTLFDVKQMPMNYKKPKRISLDDIDIQLYIKLINGNVRTPITQLAKELDVSATILKYRKKRLIENGYFLYFVAQPGDAFSSMKITYHVFTLSENIHIEKIHAMPRMIGAQSGEKTLTVMQLSLSFEDYLKYSKLLFEKLEPITQEVQTFFIDKPIILNRFSREMFIE